MSTRFAFLFLVGALALRAGETSALENVRPEKPHIPGRTFLLTDFGAVGDGKTLNTDAFEKALAAVDRAGGGKLIVPAGDFVTQRLRLCSSLELHLEKGAIISAPGHFADFGLPEPSTLRDQSAAQALTVPPALFTGKNLHDVAITGEGTIDGHGAIWWAWTQRVARANPGRIYISRPNLFVIDGCERLLIADVTFQNSPKFHVVPRRIHDLTIERVKVRALENAQNTDAIDPGPVTNAWIHDCDIDTGDDDIVIKSGGHNILIENCAIHHGHGISIGSETTAGIDGMLVRHCTFDGTDNGIRIKSMRGAGGLVQHVRYADIQMRNVGEAIVLDLNYTDNNRPNFKGEPGKIPAIHEVEIDHLTVESAMSAGRIIGLPESKITDIEVRDSSITADHDFIIKDADSLTWENVTKHIAANQP